MSSNLSDDFDTRRIGWWQRRSAVRRIKKAAGISDVDRELRLQQAGGAQTRGEISALTRGLSGGAASSYPATAPGPSAARAQYAAPQQPPVRRRSTGGKILLLGFIALFTVGGGLVSCVSDVVESSSQSSSGSSADDPVAVPPAGDFDTQEGWTAMIDAFDDEADLEETVLLIARSRSATLSVAKTDTSARAYYLDGTVTRGMEVTRNRTEEVFDLNEIDPEVVREAVARAQRSSGASDSSDAWTVQITRGARGPQVYVSIQDGTADSYALLVDAKGKVIYELP